MLRKNIFVFLLKIFPLGFDLKHCELFKEAIELTFLEKSGWTPFQGAVDLGDKESVVFLGSKGARALAPPGVGYSKYYNMFLQLP